MSLVGMALVHHHISQVGQDARKLRVQRQDASVQHIWVGDQQLRPVPGVTPVSLHSTAIQH